ncbi:MAG: DUF2283 domain-containing protein [Candidatus Altiarchaeota archaeon]|nr:DUF2283 domain-containing protein [Candidatus Altiarchaeota archaeon]
MAKENSKDIPKGLMYDEEEDILFFTRGKPSKGTLEIWDFIIDIDENGDLTSLELLNASTVLNTKKSLLSSIESAKIRIVSTPNSFYLTFILLMAGMEKEITAPIHLVSPLARREPIVSSSWTTYKPIPV